MSRPRRRGDRRGFSARALAAAALLAAASSAAAQWQIIQDARVGAARAVDVAYVENDRGDVLQIYREPNGAIRGTLALGGGFERLAAELCPSYRVDGRRPGKLGSEEEKCLVEPQRVHFVLGEVRRGRIRSSLLLELMNGARVVFRYRLGPPQQGYRESTFTLSGSKGALQAALGPNLSVVPR